MHNNNRYIFILFIFLLDRAHTSESCVSIYVDELLLARVLIYITNNIVKRVYMIHSLVLGFSGERRIRDSGEKSIICLCFI